MKSLETLYVDTDYQTEEHYSSFNDDIVLVLFPDL